MLSGAGLSLEFWVEVVNTACYLLNRFPSSNLVNKTPYEVWASKNPSLVHLRVFRCDPFLHVPKEKRSKLDSKYKKCILIGYKYGLKGYKLWNPMTRKIVYSQDVIFKEIGDTFRNEGESRGEEPQQQEFKLRNDESNSQEGSKMIELDEEVEH